MKVLKKIGLSIVAFFISIKTLALKVYAKTTFDQMTVCDYGVIEPERQVVPNIARLFSNILIPLVLLVGLVVYFVKSKSKVWKKVLITISIVVLYIVFAIIMNNV